MIGRDRFAPSILTLVTALAAASSLQAQPPFPHPAGRPPTLREIIDSTIRSVSSRDPGTGYKSERRAFLLSLLGTVVPAAAVLASEPGESAGPLPGLIFLGAVLVGPSLGHFYADRPGRALAGIGVRGVALVGFAAGFNAAWNSDSGGNELTLASAAVGMIAIGWDILAAPGSARIHNAKAGANPLRVGLIPSYQSSGIGLGARIAF